jgi:hypothetical protein
MTVSRVMRMSVLARSLSGVILLLSHRRLETDIFTPRLMIAPQHYERTSKIQYGIIPPTGPVRSVTSQCLISMNVITLRTQTLKRACLPTKITQAVQMNTRSI